MQANRKLAYLLFRILLGMDIFMHGVTRVAKGDWLFAGTITAQFAHSLLPHGLVLAYALCLPWAEAVIGVLLLLGLFTRQALAAGLVVMITLIFGVCLLQNWDVAALQITYGISYAALLFLLNENGYSLDSLFRKR